MSFTPADPELIAELDRIATATEKMADGLEAALTRWNVETGGPQPPPDPGR